MNDDITPLLERLRQAIPHIPPERMPAHVVSLGAILAAMGAQMAASPLAATPPLRLVPEAPDESLDVLGAARLLGMSRDWLYRNYQITTNTRGEPLPYQRRGRSLRFSRRALEEWIAPGVASPSTTLTRGRVNGSREARHA